MSLPKGAATLISFVLLILADPLLARSEFYAPVEINGIAYGEIQVWSKEPEGELFVEAAPLRAILKSLLAQRRIRDLAEQMKLKNMTLSEESKKPEELETQWRLLSLKECGLPFEFDHERLTLKVQIPPDWFEIRDLSLQDERTPTSSVLLPSKKSGYLNVFVSDTYNWPDSAGKESNGGGIADLEGVLNYSGYVFEGRYFYQEKHDQPWRRGPFRLVHDDQRQAHRWTLGEYSLPVQGSMTSREVGGATVSRSFSIIPYKNIRPSSRATLQLLYPSEVQIYINRRYYRTIHLPPGSHTITDLPIGVGLNDVEYVIRDNLGRVERISQVTMTDAELLASGVSQYSLSYGYPYSEVGGNHSYQGTQATLSGFYRKGISDRWTLGAFGQGDSLQALMGGESMWISSAGLWRVELSGSRIYDQSSDGQARLEFRQIDDLRQKRRWGVLTSSLEYRGLKFASLGNLAPMNLYGLSANLSHTIPMGEHLSFSVGGIYRLSQDHSESLRGAHVQLSHSWKNGISGYLMYSRNERVGQDDDYIFLSFIFVPKEHEIYSSSYESQSKASHLGWQRNFGHQAKEHYVAGSVDVAPSQRDVELRWGHQGSRADLEVGHRSAEYMSVDLSNTRRSYVHLGTALVFADAHVSLSRPIGDSFALVHFDESQKQGILRVDADGVTEQIKLKPGESGVSPEVRSYHYNRIELELTEADEDYFFAPSLSLLPTYRSGTVIDIRPPKIVAIRGRLVDSLHNFTPLVAGKIEKIHKDTGSIDSEFVRFFTDREGLLFVEGVTDGRYRLTLFEDAERTCEFEILPDSKGVVDVGDLILVER